MFRLSSGHVYFLLMNKSSKVYSVYLSVNFLFPRSVTWLRLKRLTNHTTVSRFSHKPALNDGEGIHDEHKLMGRQAEFEYIQWSGDSDLYYIIPHFNLCIFPQALVRTFATSSARTAVKKERHLGYQKIRQKMFEYQVSVFVILLSNCSLIFFLIQ